MPRVLLLLPSTTYRAPDFLEAARDLAVDVVVATDSGQAMARSMGDRSLTLPLRDPERGAEAIVAHAARAPIDGIVAVDDAGVVAGALAAARLGLPHNPPDAVRATRDKLRLRRRLDGRVPQPAFRPLAVGDDPAAVAAEVGLPCVVKPRSLSASQGVIRADTPGEVVAAAARVRHILDCAGADRGETLLVESFVAGREVAVEGLLRDGQLEVLAVFDKPDPLDGPYFEETLYVTPSRLPAEDLAAVAATTATAAEAIGLTEGPVHAELRVGADGAVTFLELAARSIGGLCARSLRFGLGVRLEELVLRHALGQPLEVLHREPGASGVMMLPIPRRGVLRAVHGQDRARAVDGVVGLEITVPPGREVVPLPEGDRYLGFLFARGATPEAVEAALRAGHARLDVDVAPSDAAHPDTPAAAAPAGTC